MTEPCLLENVHAARESARAGGAALGALFQGSDFFEHHTDGRGAFFEWEDDGRVVASIHFTPVGDEGLWRSPARGTFGGYAFVPELRLDGLLAFHDAVHARLTELGARRVEVLPAPMAHDPVAFSNQCYLLRARGYETTHCDLNHSLHIDTRPLGERMSYGNLKRLRKCEREGMVGVPLAVDALPEVVETLAANRASKGHVLSMTLAQLQSTAERFPQAMRLFGCRDGERLAAAALCLDLGGGVLYVFYWGDLPGYANLSPVVAVADAIHRYAQDAGLRLIDVGTSTIDREPNPGLIQFKRALGFSESLKLRLARNL
jgi:hypothetical protein